MYNYCSIYCYVWIKTCLQQFFILNVRFIFRCWKYASSEIRKNIYRMFIDIGTIFEREILLGLLTINFNIRICQISKNLLMLIVGLRNISLIEILSTEYINKLLNYMPGLGYKMSKIQQVLIINNFFHSYLIMIVIQRLLTNHIISYESQR